jgi:hypothetical protein
MGLRDVHRLGTVSVSLGLVALIGSACSTVPPDVRLDPPTGLVNEIDYPSNGGSWAQVSTVHGDELTVELTLRLPPAQTAAEQGTVVALWALQDEVSDADLEVTTERLHDLPRAEVVPIECDRLGSCVLQLRIIASTAPALEAANIDWVQYAGVALAVTVVRTFDHGSFVQAVQPEWAAGQDREGGTLREPSDMSGPLSFSALISPAEATPTEIPGDEFVLGRTEPGHGPRQYDWIAAVRNLAGGAGKSLGY